MYAIMPNWSIFRLEHCDVFDLLEWMQLVHGATGFPMLEMPYKYVLFNRIVLAMFIGMLDMFFIDQPMLPMPAPIITLS